MLHFLQMQMIRFNDLRCPHRFSLMIYQLRGLSIGTSTIASNTSVYNDSKSNGIHKNVHIKTQERLSSEVFHSYGCLLQVCVNTKSLRGGKQVHGHMIKTGFQGDIFAYNNLVNMYAKSGLLEEAYQVFVTITERNVVSWTAMIAGYVQDGQGKQALDFFCQMHRVGAKPNQFTLASFLWACTGLASLEEGMQVHAFASKTGFRLDVFVGSALVDMYAKCGNIEDARNVFDEMLQKNAVSWTAMVVGYAQNQQGEEALKLFCQMQWEGIEPDGFSLSSVLGVCATLAFLQEGKQIQAHVIKSGLESDVSVRNVLVDMYAKCCHTEDALVVFEKMSRRNAVSWTTMIAGYAQNFQAEEALKLFQQMLWSGMRPDQFTYASVVNACASLAALEEGSQIHAYITKSGVEVDEFVKNALVDMYAKCGSLLDACTVFDKMLERTVVSCNAMIAGYAQHGQIYGALELLVNMQRTGMKPNQSTFVSVIRACASAVALEQGKQVHAHIIKTDIVSDIFVGSALVDLYCKCGSIVDASKIFSRMPERDTVSWNAMVAGYAMNEHGEETFNIYTQMLWDEMKPNHFTFVGVLTSCADLATLEQGIQIHNQIIKLGFESDAYVGNALVDMYAKCGVLEHARKLFDQMFERDVVCWNAMISRYAQHGHGKEALALFAQMQDAGVKPTHITFVGILSACSHVGLVDEGYHYFESMNVDYGIEPRIEHYACMVDLLGRAGLLVEAKGFIDQLAFEPGALLWRTLLGACRVHGNVNLGRLAAERVLELEPQDAGSYVLLSNIYASAGNWDEVIKVRKMMNDRGVKKEPGRSWIEVQKRVHVFVVGDRSHPQTDEIYAKLDNLTEQIKSAGYVPDINFVLRDMEQEQKKYSLTYHSEKLAIAFGLLNTAAGTHIRIIKNLRVCGDCHTAFKFISKLVERKIVVRDTNRFHHFQDGLCSCGDYW